MRKYSFNEPNPKSQKTKNATKTRRHQDTQNIEQKHVMLSETLRFSGKNNLFGVDSSIKTFSIENRR